MQFHKSGQQVQLSNLISICYLRFASNKDFGYELSQNDLDLDLVHTLHKKVAHLHGYCQWKGI